MHTSTEGNDSVILPYGQFFGHANTCVNVNGFAVAELYPTVPEREVVRHTHEEAHFVLLLAGRYLTAARHAPAVCVPGALIYNPPGTTHRDRFDSAEGRFLTLSISAQAIQGVEECAALPQVPLYLSGLAEIYARRLAREANVERVSWLEIEALALELLTLTSFKTAGDYRKRPGWLECVRQLLHDKCDEEILLTEVAAVAGVHPVHLTRSFRQHFRCTPGDYLRQCRLDRAAALLTRTTLEIAEIAILSGFADQSHLTRHFKRTQGETPRVYRRRLGR